MKMMGLNKVSIIPGPGVQLWSGAGEGGTVIMNQIAGCWAAALINVCSGWVGTSVLSSIYATKITWFYCSEDSILIFTARQSTLGNAVTLSLTSTIDI